MEVWELAHIRAVHLGIPEHRAIQRNLATLENREVVLADGHRPMVPDVGLVDVRFRNRRCFNGAMVLGNEVLPGPSRSTTGIWCCDRSSRASM